jgi:hypothetical protein
MHIDHHHGGGSWIIVIDSITVGRKRRLSVLAAGLHPAPAGGKTREVRFRVVR